MKKILFIFSLLFPHYVCANFGVWATSCDDDGFFVDLSHNHTDLIVNDNQIAISVKSVQRASGVIEIFYTQTLDLGRGGMNLSWHNFDPSKSIAEMNISNEKGYFRWLGFYDKKEHKYVWAKDPDFVQLHSGKDGYMLMKRCY
jgi:hypothetical protein